MAWYDNFMSFLSPSANAMVDDPQAVSLAREGDRIAQAKQDALEQARQAAHDRVAQLEQERGHRLTEKELEQLGMPQKPTLADYYSACADIGEQYGFTQEEWNPKVIANLNGQNLNGFKISEPQKQKAYNLPQEKPVVKHDYYNLDSDGAINDFYTNVSFNEANLKNCFVEPATSFNEELARAASLDNVTFNKMGMVDGQPDKFVFGQGEYKDIKLTNVNGGALEFHGSQVDGLDMQGAKVAAIIIGDPKAQDPNKTQHVSINNLNAQDAHVVNIQQAPNTKGEINHADFKNATVDAASNMQGITLRDVKFKHTNLGHVDLSGANLVNVKFKDCDTKHLDLQGATLNHVKFKEIKKEDLKHINMTGARLQDVSINGHAIKSAQDLKDLGITNANGVSVSISKEFLLQQQLSGVSANAYAWNTQLAQAKQQEKQPPQPAPQTQQQPEKPVAAPSTPPDKTPQPEGQGLYGGPDQYTAMNTSAAAPRKDPAPSPSAAATAPTAEKPRLEVYEPTAEEMRHQFNPGAAIAAMKSEPHKAEDKGRSAPARGGRA